MTTKKKKTKKIRGIGGWLILPIIGFCGGVILMLWDILLLLSLIGQSSYPLDLFIILDVGILFLYCYTLIFIFKKKKDAPTLAIITFWTLVAYNFITSVIFGDFDFNFAGILGAIIWTRYFKKSKRVKNTFIK